MGPCVHDYLSITVVYIYLTTISFTIVEYYHKSEIYLGFIMMAPPIGDHYIYFINNI